MFFREIGDEQDFAGYILANYREEPVMATKLTTQRKAVKEAADDIAARIAALQAQQAEAVSLLATLRPDQPSGLGTVVRFKKWGDYTYAAIRAGNSWYITQDPTRVSSRVGAKSWDGLLEWMTDRNWDTIEVLS